MNSEANELKEHEQDLERLCQSKCDEFAVLGNLKISKQDIWDCVTAKYRKGYPPLYQIVSDILSLKVTDYMNWATLSSIKGKRF